MDEVNKEEALRTINNLLEQKQDCEETARSKKKAIEKMASWFNIKVDFEKNEVVTK